MRMRVYPMKKIYQEKRCNEGDLESYVEELQQMNGQRRSWREW